jgi:hypothetical protein
MQFLSQPSTRRVRARALLPLFAFLFFLVPTLARARSQAIDFNVSPNAIAADYSARVFSSGFGFDVYGLHHSRRGNVFAAGFALHANADPGGPPVRVSLGVRALDVDSFFVHRSGGAVGFRLGVRYVVPQYNRIGFGGSVVYAPNVTSFDRLARFAAFEGYAGYYLIRHGLLFVAYRHVAAAYDTTPLVTLDSGFNVGFRISF